MKDLLLLSHDIHEGNKSRGFWGTDPEMCTGSVMHKSQKIALMHSELSEAYSAYFDMDPDQKPKTEYPLTVEELADTAIRILDYMYGFDLLTVEILENDGYDKSTDYEHELGDAEFMLLNAHLHVSNALEDIRNTRNEFNNLFEALLTVHEMCDFTGHLLIDAVQAKLAYNATRIYKHDKIC